MDHATTNPFEHEFSMERAFYKAFFHSRSDYYLQCLDLYHAGKRFQFNLPAFFFGIFWFLYRKLYREALFILFFSIALFAFESILIQRADEATARYISLGFSLGGAIAIGITANFLYLQKAERIVKEAVSNYSGYDQAMLHVRRRGGVQWLWLPAVILLVILYMVYLHQVA